MKKTRRISVRTKLLNVQASVTEDEAQGWHNVTVRDISDGGLSFASNRSYPLDMRLKLEGDVSDYVRSIDISCDVEIIFCERAEDGFLCGARFMNLSSSQRTTLSIFIELIVTKHPDLLDQDV